MKVQVEIQGRTYTVRSDEPGLDLPAIARYVDGRIQTVALRAPPGLDEHTVALLACLNIASDFERFRREVAVMIDGLDRDLGAAELRLRSALPGDDEPPEPVHHAFDADDEPGEPA